MVIGVLGVAFVGLIVVVAVLIGAGVIDPPPEPEVAAPAEPPEAASTSPSEDETPSPSPDAATESPAATPEPSEGPADPTPAPAAAEPLPDYDIVETDDAGGNRVQARVVVHGQPDAETVHRLARQLVLDLRESEPYSGLALGFYEHEAQCCSTYTLGRLEDAPRGRWEDAYGRQPGNYDGYEYYFEGRQLDWSQQPTEAEYALSGPFLDRLYTEEGEDEPALMRSIAEEQGVTFEEVERAVEHALFWFWDAPTIELCGELPGGAAEPCEFSP